MNKYQIVPYDPDRGFLRDYNSTILDHFCAHPEWMSVPTTPDAQRSVAAWYLTNPGHRIYEVWKSESPIPWLDGELVGIVLLTRVVPNVDALLHFTFLDGHLFGKPTILKNFVRYALADLGFQRVSFEVPECFPKLAEFAKRKLGFRFEGQDSVDWDSSQLRAYVKSRFRAKQDQDTQQSQFHREVSVYIAAQGSRREHSHWYNGQWHDVLLLRVTRHDLGLEPLCPSILQLPCSSAPSLEQEPEPSLVVGEPKPTSPAISGSSASRT